jgi:hypothetical protein
MEKRETPGVEGLLSNGFLSGLTLLLLNDFVLKPQFHNVLTGKLSDFAGLFILPMFVAAFVPRSKIQVYLLTAVLFVFWKSPFSQPAIDLWNNRAMLRIGRVVDYSDLSALLILPVSFFYPLPRSGRRNRLAVAMILPLTIFAFSATSYHQGPLPYSYKKDYQFDDSKSQLIAKIKKLKPNFVFAVDERVGIGTYSAKYSECPDKELNELNITVFIDEMNGISTLSLREIAYNCGGKKLSQEQLRQFFEEDLIEKLRVTK